MSETITTPIFDVSVPVPALSKGEREHRAFLHMLPGLLATHRGKYVAVHEGQVMDSDANDIVLIQRVQSEIKFPIARQDTLNMKPYVITVLLAAIALLVTGCDKTPKAENNKDFPVSANAIFGG